MGKSFDLSDVVGAFAETSTDFFVCLPGVEQGEDAALDSAGGAAHEWIRAGDGGPVDDSLDVFGALADSATDLVYVDAVVNHVEHTSFEWSQVWHLIAQIIVPFVVDSIPILTRYMHLADQPAPTGTKVWILLGRRGLLGHRLGVGVGTRVVASAVGVSAFASPASRPLASHL